MRKKNSLWLIGILLLILAFVLFSGMRQKPQEPQGNTEPDVVVVPENPEPAENPPQEVSEEDIIAQLKERVPEDGEFDSKEEVAVYLFLYGKLPSNYITKKEAGKLGWEGGGLDDYSYGKCIGGDRFGNNEELLPEKKGRQYYECDIDTMHQKSRGAKRIVYSNDGLIYYTEDHYQSFELLYGEEE